MVNSSLTLKITNTKPVGKNGGNDVMSNANIIQLFRGGQFY